MPNSSSQKKITITFLDSVLQSLNYETIIGVQYPLENNSIDSRIVSDRKIFVEQKIVHLNIKLILGASRVIHNRI